MIPEPYFGKLEWFGGIYSKARLIPPPFSGHHISQNAIESQSLQKDGSFQKSEETRRAAQETAILHGGEKGKSLCGGGQ